MVYTREFVIDGESATLVIARLTFAEWARFSAQLDRIRTIDERGAAPDVPSAASAIELGSAASIESAVSQRAARAAAIEAEALSNLEFAAWAIGRAIVTWGDVPGPALWDQVYTRPAVWGALLWAVWEEHALSAAQKKTLQLRFGSTGFSAASVADPSGDKPGEAVPPVAP